MTDDVIIAVVDHDGRGVNVDGVYVLVCVCVCLQNGSGAANVFVEIGSCVAISSSIPRASTLNQSNE